MTTVTMPDGTTEPLYPPATPEQMAETISSLKIEDDVPLTNLPAASIFMASSIQGEPRDSEDADNLIWVKSNQPSQHTPGSYLCICVVTGDHRAIPADTPVMDMGPASHYFIRD